LTSPLRDRFGVILNLELYDEESLKKIVKRSSKVLNIEIDDDGALEIAQRSRGTPRVANRLLKRVRDYAQVVENGVITKEVAENALKMMEIDKLGLDSTDKKMILTIVENFNGGPVGLDTLAAATGEEKETIEDVYEPYLIQIGFLNRTPRGRVLTRKAYNYFNLPYPEEELE
jgi:Holliday junction DNA helicase RuvB